MPKKRKVVARSAAPAKAPRRGVTFAAEVRFPIVGVGASAGGLEAFTKLLRRVPVDTGMGFVLVQHLDPAHESALARLLAGATAMPVREAGNRMRVEPNHVYVIPPNTSLSIAKGVLRLHPRAPAGKVLRSIDHFLESLAKDRRTLAIGVVLSGTASDGTSGLAAIKAAGGVTFAQDNSAGYPSMPQSAVAAGCVDFVLAPGEIAKELARIARHPFVAGPAPGRPAKAAVPTDFPSTDGYGTILQLLRSHSGVDFSLYKSTTILRRIMRRTVLNKQDSLESYAVFLRGNPAELDALYSDALIGVTSFFRNPEVFAVLRHKVFPKLARQGDRAGPLRVWVAGCSTGQEAYSIMMTFLEEAEQIPGARKLQIFATDLNEANLEIARLGLYPKSLTEGLSPERLRRFFVEEPGGYRLIKSIRERVVFARQNLIGDPPFSRMDFISCRNLMIYLEPGAQKRVLSTFHYALEPSGCLLLGASESIGGFADLFAPLDKKQKLFSRKAAPTPAFRAPARKEAGPLRSPGTTPRLSPAAGNPPVVPAAFPVELSAEREADRLVVNRFAPPGVLISADLQVLQFRGATGAFLELAPGKPSFDLLKMARPGLMLPLRSAINRAKQENGPVRITGVSFGEGGKSGPVTLEVVPLRNLQDRCFLVLFEAAGAPPGPSGEADAAISAKAAGDSGRVAGLERDLGEMRDYLHSVQSDQEAANEELQASNQEGQSANEELQSLNEELETSREELESTNEELTTVNDEMVGRNAELNRLNGDLTNLQASTRLAILLLGRDLSIRRFTPQAGKKFSLLPTDIGRSFGAVRHTLQVSDLETVIAEVIAKGRECEREVRDQDGRWYSLRVRPYLTAENRVDGAVLVLFDIDELKRTERLISAEHEHAEAIVRTVFTPLVILGADLRIKSANDAFYRNFKVTRPEAKDRLIFQLGRGSWNIPRLRHLLEEIIPRNNFFDAFALTQTFERIGRRSLLLNARVLDHAGGKPKEILLGIQDVTEVLAFETGLRRSELRHRRLFEAAKDGILILDPKTRRITEANPFIAKFLGYPRGQLIGKELWEIGLLKDETASRQAFRDLKKKRFIRYEDLPLQTKGGRCREVEFVGNLYTEDGLPVIQCNVRDITARKHTEAALAEVRTQLAVHANELDNVVVARTAELRAANARLEASVASIRQARDEHHELFLESQFMQEKLRQLTRQVLTAQEEERRKISRDLHDDVVQTLVGINVELSALGQAAKRGPRALQAKLKLTRRLVEKSVDAVHRFARELRPAVLDDLGLIPALQAYIKLLAERKHLKISLTAFAGVDALDNARRTVLYRVAQEALTNVARHAQAHVVTVTLRKLPGGVCLEVHDDGISFHVPQVLSPKANKRLGLLGMRERVEMVGGLLVIASARGQGTTVRAEIPWRDPVETKPL